MADDDIFAELLPPPPKRPAAEASAPGLDDIFTEESPVLAQPVSEGPGSSSARSNGDISSPFARPDGTTTHAAMNHAPMGLPAAKREAQHVEAVLQRFAAGLEKVLAETNRCETSASNSRKLPMLSVGCPRVPIPLAPKPDARWTSSELSRFHRRSGRAALHYLCLCIWRAVPCMSTRRASSITPRSCRNLTTVEAKVDALAEAVSDLRAQSDGAAGAAAGRMVSLEAAVREVSRGLQMVRDRQELADAQAELSHLAVKVRVPAECR